MEWWRMFNVKNLNSCAIRKQQNLFQVISTATNLFQVIATHIGLLFRDGRPGMYFQPNSN